MSRSIAQRPKEIAYAEDQLGILRIWDELDSLTTDHGNLLGRKSNILGQFANVEEKVRETERELTTKLMVEDNYATMSVAAQERAVKAALLNDDNYQSLLGHRASLKGDLETVETDLRAVEIAHRTADTKLKSVASYLDFLTAARNARSVAENALPY